MLAFKAPVLVALISYLPVVMLLAHFLTAVVGLHEFSSAHELEVSLRTVVRLAVAWFPYQIVLSYAALRAVRRQARGVTNWEKTQHVGAHRAHLRDRAIEQVNDNAA